MRALAGSNLGTGTALAVVFCFKSRRFLRVGRTDVHIETGVGLEQRDFIEPALEVLTPAHNKIILDARLRGHTGSAGALGKPSDRAWCVLCGCRQFLLA